MTDDDSTADGAGADAAVEPTGTLDAVAAELEGGLIGRAAVTGVWSFLAGYLLTVAIIVLGPSRSAGPLGGVLNAVAFVFYSAHNISVVSPEVTYNTLVLQAQYGQPAVPIAVFFALPPVVLLATGAAYATRMTEVTLDRVAQASLGLALGYAAIALAGSFVVTLDVSHPSHVRSVLFGLAYPVAFCLLGGLAVLGYRRRAG